MEAVEERGVTERDEPAKTVLVAFFSRRLMGTSSAARRLRASDPDAEQESLNRRAAGGTQLSC
jgi:hypothetical protein